MGADERAVLGSQFPASVVIDGYPDKVTGLARKHLYPRNRLDSSINVLLGFFFPICFFPGSSDLLVFCVLSVRRLSYLCFSCPHKQAFMMWAGYNRSPLKNSETETQGVNCRVGLEPKMMALNSVLQIRGRIPHPMELVNNYYSSQADFEISPRTQPGVLKFHLKEMRATVCP